jgi:hypothetical protein
MADKAKENVAKAKLQRFFVPSIGKTVEVAELTDGEAAVAHDKTNQEIEVGDGNS